MIEAVAEGGFYLLNFMLVECYAKHGASDTNDESDNEPIYLKHWYGCFCGFCCFHLGYKSCLFLIEPSICKGKDCILWSCVAWGTERCKEQFALNIQYKSVLWLKDSINSSKREHLVRIHPKRQHIVAPWGITSWDTAPTFRGRAA